jgi:TM2 domain-containing membrane protein YozV
LLNTVPRELHSKPFAAILAYFQKTRTAMAARHKNKALSTLLAFLLGGLGVHRLYLGGARDPWLWLHLAALPLSGLIRLAAPSQPLLFVAAPLVISYLAGFIEALVIGLTPDEKWDAAHNAGSGRLSDSGWPVALLLVATLGVGAVALIAAIARTFDLLITGGSYG